MVLAYKKKQQKNRSFIPFKYSKIRFGNSAIIALSSGFLYSKTIKNFYIMFKKFFNIFRSITKFWIYINVYYIITKKPLNVRMGKGKGSRKGRLSLVNSGNSIVELKYCRFGLFFKLYKYISTRCSFNTNYIYNKNVNLSRFNLNIINYSTKCKNVKKLKTKSYIVSRMSEVLDIYSKISDIKRYKKINTLFNSYFKLNNCYSIFIQKVNFWHIISYLKYYLKKKKKII